MINKIHERALRIVLNVLLRNMNDITIHHRNIQTLMIELFKIKYDLAPPIMGSMLNRKTICYNFRNLQEFQSERKNCEKAVFYGLETISYRAPQLWTILPEEFKQRNPISLFKSDVRHWRYNECPCRLCKVFVPNSREIHVQLEIYWYLLLFDMHLPASTHFINVIFSMLLGFLLSMSISFF